MTKLVKQNQSQINTRLSDLGSEVLAGLQSTPKTLPSKYFYDKKGDELFQQIMQLEEYYLTNSEFEILEKEADNLLQLFAANAKPFNLIELGAGDGLKTKILLRHFYSASAKFSYIPIDISENAVNKLSEAITQDLPELNINPLVMDFFQGLEVLGKQKTDRKVVLFLGSSIGNFPHHDALHLLSELHKRLSAGDLLLIGFDLKKDPETILAAYNDASGITREFNLNLLDRINRETGANFNRNHFIHYPLYDPVEAEARSYLISTKKQQVRFPEAGVTVEFDQWEAIHTEISRKYSITQTDLLAAQSGFAPIKHFTDKKGWFLDALWQKK